MNNFLQHSDEHIVPCRPHIRTTGRFLRCGFNLFRASICLIGLASSCDSTLGADVSLYYIAKSQGWTQTGPANISRSTGNKYVFSGQFIEAIQGTVGSGSVTLPTAQELPFVMIDNRLAVIWSTNDNIGLAAFNTNFPNGTYVMRLTTIHDGSKLCSLRLTNDVYPSIPSVSNYDAAQVIDSTKPFTLQWLSLGGGSSDFVHFSVEQVSLPASNNIVFSTGYPGATNALNGLSTSVTIPANTFGPGVTYWAHIWSTMSTDINTTSYQGATGYAGYGQNLYFTMKTIGSPLPPTLTNQPQSQTVTAGSTATFVVAATGTPPLSYQWRKDGINILGANATNLMLINVQATNAGNYSVLVTNSAGTVTSSNALLAVLVVPVISVQPVGLSVFQGQKAAFDVTATGGALAYHWRKNGTNLSGGLSAVYSITNTQPADVGNYSAVVSNTAGSVTSSNAVLAVIPNTNINADGVLSLDGVSGFMIAPHAPELNQSSGDFTISAWVFLKNYNSLNRAILTKRSPGSQHGWMLYVGGLSQGGEVRKAAFGISEAADPRVVSNKDIKTNEWHHISVVYNSDRSNADLYVDGQLDGSSLLPPPVATTADVYLGRDSKDTQYYWSGYLDEVCVWSRALTSHEVLAKMPCKRSGAEPGLLAYWNFDGGLAADLTGHGHTGTLANTAAIIPSPGNDSVHLGCNPLSVSSVSLTLNHQPNLFINGPTGMDVRVETSTNLLQWTPLITLPNPAGTIQFTDPASGNYPFRFYRATLP
jgi:hypothetical protein